MITCTTERLGSLAYYECLELLAVSGASAVYFVRHRVSAKLYAMKVLPCPADEPYTRQTVHARREQHILRVLNHPFVCGLHDTFEDDHRLYLVLHFQAGGTLDDVREFWGGRIPETSVQLYAAEMIIALEYVHTMGFVYRDLKPQNVLIAADGHIKLTDFGVAHEGISMDNRWENHPNSAGLWLKPDKTSTSRGGSTTTGSVSCDDDGGIDFTEPDTIEAKLEEGSGRSLLETGHYLGIDDRVTLRSNSFVGSIDYMAPEMIRQHDVQSTDLDWWALGCTMYELLYGHPPFQSKEEDTKPCPTNVLFRRILTGALKFPQSPPVSASCKSLIRQLLSVDTTKRLGHHHGSTEVKNHRFFDGIRWATLYHTKPPVRPRSGCGASHYKFNTYAIEATNADDGTSSLSEWARWLRDIPDFECEGEGIECQRAVSTRRYQYEITEPRPTSLQKLLSLLKIESAAL